MATAEKLFTVAGTAALGCSTKVRFANDLVARIKILAKAGWTDINLVELPSPMTKLEALLFLQASGVTEGEAGFAVTTKLAEKRQLAKKNEVKVAGSTKATKVTKAVQATKVTKVTKPKTTVKAVLTAVADSVEA
jgi:hypothetical protein